MKLDGGKLQAVIRRKREEAGEVIRPTKRIRRKARDDPAQASEAPAETTPIAAATTEALAEEPERGTPLEVLASGDVPAEIAPAEGSGEDTLDETPTNEGTQVEAASMEVGERGQPAQAKRTAKGSPVTPTPAVIDLEAKREE